MLTAFCPTCARCTPMAAPVPTLTIIGTVTLRTGRCGYCCSPTYRVGGARRSDPIPQESGA